MKSETKYNILKGRVWVEAPQQEKEKPPLPTAQPVREQKKASERQILSNLFDLIGTTATINGIGRVCGKVYEVSYIPMPEPRRQRIDPILPVVVGVNLQGQDAVQYKRIYGRLSACIVECVFIGFDAQALRTIKEYGEFLYGIIGKHLSFGERKLYARVIQDAYLYPARHAAGL